MKFSVIIPVYNVEKYLRDCLDSVLAQSYTDWEAVCVDDGSTDSSLEIVKEYNAKDRRIKVIHKDNGGLSSARNAGIKAAQGEYLIFLDSDDWISEQLLEKVADVTKGEDLICFSGVKYFEADKSFSAVEHLSPAEDLTGMQYFDRYSMDLKELHFDCTVSRAYRRDYLIESGLLFKVGRLHEDFLFTPQACWYAKRVRVIDECLYYYRIRPGSITTSANSKGYFDYIQSNNELAAFFISKDCDKAIAYARICQSYQIFILRSDKEKDKAVKRLIDWNSYKTVSKNKPRHRLNFFLARISMKLARIVIKNEDKLGEFVRFCIVGLVATLIHYGVYLAFLKLISPSISYTIGYIVSLCVNVALTSKYTFKTDLTAVKTLGFLICHGINYLLHIAFLNIFLYLGVAEKLAPIPVYCIVIPINFILVRTVFKKIRI